MTPTILWPLVTITGAVATYVAVRIKRARARGSKDRSRPIHEVCAGRGHQYQTYGTGYRCNRCGNHVSATEGALYGRTEDGRQERRREPR